MAGPDGWVSKGRPMSTIALNFSAALDDLFNLRSTELEETVEQKNREVQTQKSELEELDSRLRQTEEKLKNMEMRHKRMSRHFQGRTSVQGLFTTNNNSDTDDSETSPQSATSQPTQS